MKIKLQKSTLPTLGTHEAIAEGIRVHPITGNVLKRLIYSAFGCSEEEATRKLKEYIAKGLKMHEIDEVI